MKHYIALLLIGGFIFTSCGQNKAPQTNTPATSSQPVTQQAPPPSDTSQHASVDTVQQPIVEPPFPYSGQTFTCNDLSQTIEFYESAELEMPADSLLERMGIGVERGEGSITLTTDSTAIKEIMETVTVTRKGKKITVTYDGHSKEYTGSKVSLDEGNLTIDGKEIAYMDAPKFGPLRIGIPRASDLVVTGSANVTCHATLHQLNANIKGKGSYVYCDSVHKMQPLYTKDSSAVAIKYVSKASMISLTGAGDITIATVDTVPITNIMGSGNILLPKNAFVMSQKIKGDGEVVMR